MRFNHCLNLCRHSRLLWCAPLLLLLPASGCVGVASQLMYIVKGINVEA